MCFCFIFNNVESAYILLLLLWNSAVWSMETVFLNFYVLLLFFVPILIYWIFLVKLKKHFFYVSVYWAKLQGKQERAITDFTMFLLSWRIKLRELKILISSLSLSVLYSHQPRKKRRLAVPLVHSSSAGTDGQEKTDSYSLSVDANRVPFVRIDAFINLLQNVERIEVGGTQEMVSGSFALLLFAFWLCLSLYMWLFLCCFYLFIYCALKRNLICVMVSIIGCAEKKLLYN